MFVLVFDIPADDIFINSYGGNKITPSPQGLTFIETVFALDLFFHPAGRFTFQSLDSI